MIQERRIEHVAPENEIQHAITRQDRNDEAVVNSCSPNESI